MSGPQWELATVLPVVDGARCRDYPEPLWDDHVDGETRQQRGQRHELARMMCSGCPAIRACREAWAEVGGSGIWAGQLHAEATDLNASRSRMDGWRVMAVVDGSMPADDLSSLERAEVVRQLAGQGHSDEHIGRLLGTSGRQVGRIRGQRGITSGYLGVAA